MQDDAIEGKNCKSNDAPKTIKIFFVLLYVQEVGTYFI